MASSKTSCKINKIFSSINQLVAADSVHIPNNLSHNKTNGTKKSTKSHASNNISSELTRLARKKTGFAESHDAMSRKFNVRTPNSPNKIFSGQCSALEKVYEMMLEVYGNSNVKNTFLTT